MAFFEWLQSSGLARAVGESIWLTASLSAIHLLGFTLIMGSGTVTGLRLLDAVLPSAAPADVSRVAGRILVAGVFVSAVTGLLLFAPRAGYTIVAGTFQLKLALAAAALLFHFLVLGRVAAASGAGVVARRLTGLVSLALWLGLAVTACWFILFE